jgi:glycosyltransferase involved in cell wall biosynthesis
MRAAMVLQALARHFRVTLLIVPLYPSPGAASSSVGELCEQVIVVSPDEMTPPAASWLQRALSHVGRQRSGSLTLLREKQFDIVHVFRLATLAHVRSLRQGPWRSAQWHLDLDDIESSTHRRLAELYRLNGSAAMAELTEAKADQYTALEAEALRDLDRVYVCSQQDRNTLSELARAEVCVLPNALPEAQPLRDRGDGRPFTFLFVGTLGYYANEDAVRHFCRETLPLLGENAPHELEFTIVGAGASQVVQDLAHLPAVRFIGEVPHVAPWYQEAHVVVVPLRAGGGTRIKLLEAFAYRRPVVSTTVGVEGIDLNPDEHVLLGDSPQAFAEQCLRLMSDPELGRRLAENAHSLFTRAYTTEAVARIVAGLS